MPTGTSLCFLFIAAASCFGQTDYSHFDVASVKPSLTQRGGILTGGPGNGNPGRLTYESTTLDILLRSAYGLEPFQISGPDWLRTEYYTVAATMPPDATWTQIAQMTANLLTERFGLVAHRVPKDFDGYEIVVAKGGPKLTPSPGDSTAHAEFQGGKPRTRDPNAVAHYTFTQTSMSLLTNRLQIMMWMKTPVLDHTGLTGKFDFTLDFVAPPVSARDIQGPPSAELSDNSGNISEAMQKQLGLKLNRVKVPRDVLVIDHIDRVPTPN